MRSLTETSWRVAMTSAAAQDMSGWSERLSSSRMSSSGKPSSREWRMKASRSCSGAARSWSRASRPCRAGEILASDRKGTARHPDGQPACCRLAIELLTSAEGGYWAFVAACLIGVLPVAKRPFKALRMGQPFTIESLMTIAAGGDLLIGAAEEAVSRFESFPAMSEWGSRLCENACGIP